MLGRSPSTPDDGNLPCVECDRRIPRTRFVDGKVACPWCQTLQDDAGGQVVVSPLPVGASHPKVTQRTEGPEQVYVTRQGSWFGWFWLAFTTLHCGFMFFGLAQGTVRVNGQVVTHPSVWHFLGLAAFYSIFFAVGFAFTLSRYTVRLSVVVGETIRVALAYRGARENNNAVNAVVLVSDGQEISFGSFLAKDVKAYLASAIDAFYNGAAGESADFIPKP
ncbi:MAG: hypothetical protein LW857_05170 [Verrucomicrobiae bacterium]|nr:hypothetical protein [Verrucomicrobiae bacterium]